MKLLAVVGTRPQFAKVAFVSCAIAATQGGGWLILEQFLHAGPHNFTRSGSSAESGLPAYRLV
jgi:UDP-N-acetylglucosamine 2-epimerase